MYDRTLATLGASGGGLLGAMGRYLEPLDMPRRAAWSLPGKLAQGDIVGALPGLLGVGAGGLAAATGLGIPAAIGIGSLVGGLGQAAGESADEERFRAPTPEDVTGSDNWVLNALVGAVGDPLTYAGGFGGRQAGAKAGAYMDDLATRPLPAMLGGQVDEAPAVANAFENQWHGAPPATPDVFRPGWAFEGWTPPPTAEAMMAPPPAFAPANPFGLVDNPLPVPQGWGAIEAGGGMPPVDPAKALPSSSAMGDPFYSRLQRALEEDPAKMYKTAGLEKRLLAGKIGGQGPINPDEINYAALPDLLSGQPTISKNELLRALQDQSLGVERTVLGDEAKWAQYQTPGGTNYRETLLRLPEGMTTTPYQSPHFDEPNILAHLRTNERTLPTGERMLHAEEIQSDWHQGGKKGNYMPPGGEAELALMRDERLRLRDQEAKMLRAAQDAGVVGDVRNSTPEWIAVKSRLDELNNRIAELAKAVPDAPFKETWPDLALKQLMHDAAKGNFDRVGWNSGEAIQGLVGGGLEGQQQFYDQVLPKRANKLLQALGAEGGVGPVMGPMSDKAAKQSAIDAMYAAIIDANTSGRLPPGTQENELYGQALRQVMGRDQPNWAAYGLDPEMMNRLAAAPGSERLVGHQIRMTPELRAAILKGLPLLTLGGVGGGSALMAALMNGEGA